MKKYFNSFYLSLMRFTATYRASIKTLLRAPLLWLLLLFALAMVIFKLSQVHHGYLQQLEDGTFGEMIYDNDPRYVLSYETYVGLFYNLNPMVMRYIVPLFCAISTMILLVRNHDDKVFEIEKSLNVGAGNYILGRLAAIVTINILVGLFLSSTYVCGYYFTRGGVPELDLLEYFADFSARLIRIFCNCIVPGILFYITFTLLAGTLVRNGIVGGIIGIVMAISYYLISTYWMRMPTILVEYINPSPQKLFNYWGFCGTDLFDNPYMEHLKFTESEMLAFLVTIFALSALMVIATYYSTKRRKN